MSPAERAARDREIVRLSKLRAPVAEIMERLACGESTVTRVRVREGVARNPSTPNATPEQIEEARRLMAEEKVSRAEASRRTGVSEASLWRHFPELAWTKSQAAEASVQARAEHRAAVGR